ncbi:type II toxin-antitoxin system VapC family toxin [Tsukamurella soli]|uniref:Ribonuclease VapC n=1 Tax=Tsukamurella soli TaxID=644556 RepID=A0ABP8J6P0_9ACTN
MSRWYLDTSAAAKLLRTEVESAALARELDTMGPELVACYLLETEMRRIVGREAGVTHAAVTAVIDGVDLYEVPPSLFREAGLLPGATLRSLDAIHLAAAVRLGVDAVLTYDTRMGDAARDLGLAVIAPGGIAAPLSP